MVSLLIWFLRGLFFITIVLAHSQQVLYALLDFDVLWVVKYHYRIAWGLFLSGSQTFDSLDHFYMNPLLFSELGPHTRLDADFPSRTFTQVRRASLVPRTHGIFEAL